MEQIIGNHIDIYFDSMVDFLDYQSPTNNINYARYNSEKTRRGYSKNWYGYTNEFSHQAINHAIVGDQEIYNDYVKGYIEQLDQATKQYTEDYEHVLPVVRRQRVRKSFGNELDIHSVFQGRLDKAWDVTERVEFESSKHLITLMVDICGNAGENCVDSFWNAAVCAKLVDEIEQAGKSVQLIVASTTLRCSTTGKSLTASVPIKKYNERFSNERLCAMSHLGFFRSFFFQSMLTSSELLCSGLGHYVRISEKFYPQFLKEEIKLGHTKIVNVPKSNGYGSAIRALTDSYAQLKRIVEG